MAKRTWNIDTSHSRLGFTVRHLMLMKVHGSFDKWSGTIELDDDAPASAKIHVEAEIASINTHEEKRDGHLKSADFFDAEKNPKLVFDSTGVEMLGKDKAKVKGNLTISGVTKPVTLEVEIAGQVKDPWGNTRTAFEAKTSINRSDFGLKWNQALETGGVVVGEKVDIVAEVEAIAK